MTGARPCLLPGDFSDRPDSRTLERLLGLATEAARPVEDRLSFSSTARAIDFVLQAPAERVADGPLTSDLRPVPAGLALRQTGRAVSARRPSRRARRADGWPGCGAGSR